MNRLSKPAHAPLSAYQSKRDFALTPEPPEGDQTGGLAVAELPALCGGDHWSVKTAHERLDIGNESWTGYARAARGLTAAMSALDYARPVVA